MEPSESLEWRQARQWLIVSGVIPPTHKVTKPDVDLVDFARSLRDGVFLCSLLLKLKPDCIQESDWNTKPLMQVSTNSIYLSIRVWECWGEGWRMGGALGEASVCCVAAVGIWFSSLLLFV